MSVGYTGGLVILGIIVMICVIAMVFIIRNKAELDRYEKYPHPDGYQRSCKTTEPVSIFNATTAGSNSAAHEWDTSTTSRSIPAYTIINGKWVPSFELKPPGGVGNYSSTVNVCSQKEFDPTKTMDEINALNTLPWQCRWNLSNFETCTYSDSGYADDKSKACPSG